MEIYSLSRAKLNNKLTFISQYTVFSIMHFTYIFILNLIFLSRHDSYLVGPGRWPEPLRRPRCPPTQPTNKPSRVIIIIGTKERAFSLPYFHDSNPSGPLNHMLKHFRRWFPFRWYNHICKYLLSVIDTTVSIMDIAESLTPYSQYHGPVEGIRTL